MIVLSVPQNGFFFHRAEFFTCYPSLSCEILPIFPQLDRRPLGLSTNKVWGSSGGKLLIKFGESQGAQDVKTATSY